MDWSTFIHVSFATMSLMDRGFIRTPEQAEQADVQRPTIATPADPRGGFGHNPEFEISGSIDQGNIWSSTEGNQRNRFTS